MVSNCVGSLFSAARCYSLPLCYEIIKLRLLWHRAIRGRSRELVFAIRHTAYCEEPSIRFERVLAFRRGYNWSEARPRPPESGFTAKWPECLPRPHKLDLDSIGTPIGVQQKLMRHSDIRTTMNVYGDAASEEMRSAHEKVVKLALPKPLN
jgi:hypothetical protein